MMKNTIKLGLVGLSDKMMYSLADSLKKIEKIELAAIVESDETRGREAATKYGANYVSTVTEAIDDHRLDGLCIGSELEARKGHIHVAIQRETPVLCLNPIPVNGFQAGIPSAPIAATGNPQMIFSSFSKFRFSDLCVLFFRLNFDIFIFTTRGLIRCRRGRSMSQSAIRVSK